MVPIRVFEGSIYNGAFLCSGWSSMGKSLVIKEGHINIRQCHSKSETGCIIMGLHEVQLGEQGDNPAILYM